MMTFALRGRLRSFIFCGLFSLLFPAAAQAQAQEDALLLVAHPAFRDLEYRQTVLLAAPAPNGGHVGVIINRPTRRSLGSLFPEHEPSKKVLEPVYYGGPFSRGALVALVKADSAPGAGTVPLMKNLYLAFRANTIDHVIESTPNEARYFVGYVGWRPGELKGEIDRGIWSVLDADIDIVFRKDTEGLWEELQQASKRIRADAPFNQRVAAQLLQGGKFTPQAGPVAH
jgi:putative transcriptional regulator